MPRDEHDQGYLDEVNSFIDALNAGKVPQAHPRDDEEVKLLAMARMLRAASVDDSPAAGFVKRLGDLLDQGRAAQRTGRRWLLGTIGGAAAAVAAAFVAGMGVERVTERRWQSKALVTAQGAWYRVAAEADVAPNRPLYFQAGAVQGYLVGDGTTIQARSAICTHMGCLLGWDAGQERYQCPCHGATFDRIGRSNDGRDHPTLPMIRIRVEGGSVFAWGTATIPV